MIRLPCTRTCKLHLLKIMASFSRNLYLIFRMRHVQVILILIAHQVILQLDLQYNKIVKEKKVVLRNQADPLAQKILVQVPQLLIQMIKIHKIKYRMIQTQYKIIVCQEKGYNKMVQIKTQIKLLRKNNAMREILQKLIELYQFDYFRSNKQSIKIV